ncbi:hypothetical protein WDU94_005896 [Cyamophila willieti]
MGVKLQLPQTRLLFQVKVRLFQKTISIKLRNYKSCRIKLALRIGLQESSAPEQLLLDPDTQAELDKLHSELPPPILANPALEPDVRDVIRDVIIRLTHATEQEKAPCVEDLSEMMQNFYANFAKRMESHKIYEDTTPSEREFLLGYVEKYAMICLYPILFCPPFTEDEEQDLAIQERIRQLQWVSAKHLDCGIEETNTTVLNLVYNSMGKLLEMDSARAPQDKLSRVVDCCRDIFLFLQGGPASADEFFPALIFLVLKTNLVRLKSNIHYVTRFCNANLLNAGEAGYFFTHLSGAVRFIEDLTAHHLGMDPVEFEEYMSGKRACSSFWESAMFVIEYMSGKRACSSFWESAMFVIESLHTMDEGLSTLSDLAAIQSKVLDGTIQMRSDLDTFCADITASIDRISAEIPLQFMSQEKVEFDGHLSGEGDWLVSPLQPQSDDPSTALQPDSSTTLQPDSSTTSQPEGSTTQNPPSLSSEDIIQPSLETTQLPVQNLKRGSSSAHETQGTAQHSTPQAGQTSYQGFSSQRLQIPSIPCAMEVLPMTSLQLALNRAVTVQTAKL